MSPAVPRLLEYQDGQPDQPSPDDAVESGAQHESGHGLGVLVRGWNRGGKRAFRPGEGDRPRVVTIAETLPEEQHHVDAPWPQENDRHLRRRARRRREGGEPRAPGRLRPIGGEHRRRCAWLSGYDREPPRALAHGPRPVSGSLPEAVVRFAVAGSNRNYFVRISLSALVMRKRYSLDTGVVSDPQPWKP